MSAYFDTGFSVRMPSWHGEETILSDYPDTRDEARKAAGLTWEPAKTDQAVLVPASVTLPDTAVILAILPDGRRVVDDPAHFSIVRDDTWGVLGSGVGTDYTPVSNEVMFEFAEAIAATPGATVKFETAGSVKDGAEVWCLVYLDEPYTLPGDDSATFPFMSVVNANDGSGSFRANPTQVRVVCWNTIQAATAQGERLGNQFRFHHTGKVMDRIEEAKAAVAGLRDEAKAWQALAVDLYALPINDRQLDQFLSEFIPQPVEKVISPRVQGNIDRARAQFRSMFLESVTCAAHTGTALGLVDAGTEYLDHVRGFNNRDSYLGRTILRPEKRKASLVNLARQAATW